VLRAAIDFPLGILQVWACKSQESGSIQEPLEKATGPLLRDLSCLVLLGLKEFPSFFEAEAQVSGICMYAAD